MMAHLKQYRWPLFFLLISLFYFGQSLYLLGKAQVAQYLLTTSWQANLSSLEKKQKPWPWADTYPIAQLKVPKYDIEQIVLSGANGRNLAFGPGHLSSSAQPGSQGHIIIGGHRDTHFSFLKQVNLGDEIELIDNQNHHHIYQVIDMSIHDIHQNTLYSLPFSAISLITCYPFNTINPGGSQRYVVTALPKE